MGSEAQTQVTRLVPQGPLPTEPARWSLEIHSVYITGISIFIILLLKRLFLIMCMCVYVYACA